MCFFPLTTPSFTFIHPLCLVTATSLRYEKEVQRESSLVNIAGAGFHHQFMEVVTSSGFDLYPTNSQVTKDFAHRMKLLKT